MCSLREYLMTPPATFLHVSCIQAFVLYYGLLYTDAIHPHKSWTPVSMLRLGLDWRVQAVETEGPPGNRSHADEDLPPYAPTYPERHRDAFPGSQHALCILHAAYIHPICP